jgi:hypothetical protein
MRDIESGETTTVRRKRKVFHVNNNVISSETNKETMLKNETSSKYQAAKEKHQEKRPYSKDKRTLSETTEFKVTSNNKYKLSFRKLQSMYPKLFNLFHPRPLSIGIREQLFENRQGLSKKTIRHALFFYCNSHQYLKQIKAGKNRYSFDLKKGTLVTKDESDVALQNLKTLYSSIKEAQKT